MECIKGKAQGLRHRVKGKNNNSKLIFSLLLTPCALCLMPYASSVSKAIEPLTGRVVCPPRLVRTGVKINGGTAFGTLVSLIELVREYLLLCAAAVTFADKRFEIFERLISRAMLWGRAHDKSPLGYLYCKGQ